MIKRLLLSFSLLAMAANGTAQIISSQQAERCGFDRHHRQLMLSDPAYAQRVADYEARTRHFSMDDRDAGTLFVPVVVHVLETGTAITAITDDQIRTGIRQLNERYRKVAGTPGAGNGVDTHIEFALAVRDPSGSCTTGITRHNMTGNATYMASGVFDVSAGITDAAAKSIGVWDQTKYYNIWLVSEFDNNNGGSGTQGYAFFSSSHGFPEDGTIMLVNAYKDATSITLAHELGHAFNVYHTFEGDANGTTCPTNGTCGSQGDLVCDTPPHIRSNSDCNLAGTNSCDGGSSNALFKNNYMDYSGDACQNMFTAGQNTRIQSALTVDRASFLASNGNMSLVPPGAPTMQIVASKSVLCGIGQSVQLFDWSRCIPNTYLTDPDLPGITFAWTITNGTETQNSSNQNPVFTLNSLGVFNATLQITTTLGTYTRTENGIVVVVAAPGAACTPTSLNPSGNYGLTVYNVAFNTINSATDPITSFPYTDYSCTRNTVVSRGSTYQLSISITSGSASAEVFSAYIDYNNNNVFDTGELVSSGTVTNGATTVNANVTIPVTAVTGSLLRLRVYGEVGTFVDSERTCSTQLLVADVEDYGVYVTTNLAGVSIAASPGTTISYGTNVTFTPTPVNGGAGPVYQWFRNGNAVGAGSTFASNNLLPGETISCEMFSNLAGVIASPATSNTLTMTVTGPPLSDFTGSPLRICAGGSVAFTDLSQLSPTGWSWTFSGGTPSTSSAQNPTVTYASPGTYNVTLVASNANGTGTTMTKTGYITVYAAPTAGCAITRSTATTSGIGITNVTLNTINNNTVYDGAVMNDYTCSNVTLLSANTLYNISVTVGAFNSQWVRVYIDYNGNGQFTDSGELIFAPANGTGARTGSFTTPVAPMANVLRRMRVISDFLNTTPGPCTTPIQYGQVEEYGIVFLAPLNTAPVLNTAASPALSAQNEDAVAPAGAVGTLVSSLVDLNPPAGGLDNVTDVDAGAVAGIAITAADATNGSWFYSTNNGGAWSALGTPTGVVSRLLAADANSRLYFQPLANFNGSIASAITFRAWDQTSGSNGGTADASVNGGTTAYSTATDVASIVITALNDAPVLNTAASPALAAVTEDVGAPIGAVGTPVSALVDFAAPSGQVDNVTDVDAGALTGIAITAADATNGSWFYSLNNGSAWSPLGTPSGASARLLAADANSRLYFQPSANFSGSIASAITFRAWDQTSGTNGSTADASTTGGTAAFSAASDVATLTVTAVNDAPVNSLPAAQTTPQDQTLVLSSGGGNGVSISDVDAGGASVQVTLAATNGAVSLSGVAGLSFSSGTGTNNTSMTFTGSIINVNNALNGMFFSPILGFSGTATVTITTNDQGNTGSGGNLTDVDVLTINVTPSNVQVSVKAMLEGPYDPNTGSMNDALRTANVIPTGEPYTALGYLFVGGGGESVSPTVFSPTGNNAIVDWVIVELRDNADPSIVVASRSALIQRDGDVVATDGTSPVTLAIAPGTYRVALRHRIHLGVMTLNGVPLSGLPSTVNFTSVATSTYGTAALKSVSGTFPTQALWAGDVSFNGEVKYTGSANDRDPILVTVGSTTPNNIIANTYSTRDVNMNGNVQYAGSGNDRDPILVNVGSTTPNNLRLQQLP